MGGRGMSAYKTFRGIVFKKRLEHGMINLGVDTKNQLKHQNTPQWKNQVKQAVEALKNGAKGAPKSRLSKSVDPQKLINDYAGKGFLRYRKNQRFPEEFVRLPFEVGRTFDKQAGKYIVSHTIQIKYSANGPHVFPTKDW